MRSVNDHAAIHAMRPSGPCDQPMIMRLSMPCGLRDHAIIHRSCGYPCHAAVQVMRSFNDHVACCGHAVHNDPNTTLLRWWTIGISISLFFFRCSDKTPQTQHSNVVSLLFNILRLALSRQSLYQNKTKNQIVIHYHGVLKNTLF